jgi:uncharacterized alpha-E superfamily protein
MLPTPLRAEELSSQRRVVSSRSAENLFWMGRYAERAEQSVRLARASLSVIGDAARSPSPLLEVVAVLCEEQGLVPPEAPAPGQSIAVYERTLIAGLADPRQPSVAFDLAALARAASHIRDRLSVDHWRLVSSSFGRFEADCARARADGTFSVDEAVAALGRLAVHLSAITGAQVDQMTRDDGWRLMTIGRQLERLGTLARALEVMFDTGAIGRDDGYDFVLQLFDSTITYRALYQRRLEIPPLVDLLVQESANPRSLHGMARRIGNQIERLGTPGADQLLAHLPSTSDWPLLAALSSVDDSGRHAALLQLTARLATGSRELSDAIGARYFSHATEAFRTVTA